MAEQLDQGFKGLPLHGIISAPLQAAAQANSAMAREQTKFLLEFCFGAKGDGNDYEAVMINMSITRTEVVPAEKKGDSPTLRHVKAKFQVPLLTLVPLSSLAVTEVDIDFTVDVTYHKESDNPPPSTAQTQSPPKTTKNTNIYGQIGGNNSNNSSGNSAKNYQQLNISVKARPLPLPTGLTSIIKAYENSIEAIEVNEKQPDNS